MYRYWLLILGCLWALSSHAAKPPADDPGRYVSHEIAITGAVENRLSLTEADLAALPQTQIGEVQVVCQSGANMGKKENLTGVRLRDLLERAQLHADNHLDFRQMVIIAKAKDGYRVVYSWGELFNSPVGDDIYVYFRKNGLPLGDDEGRFALIPTGDLRTGARQVKWLSEIEVRKVAR